MIQWKSKPHWAPMKVSECMSTHVVCVEENRRVRELARIMRDQKVGCIPVVSGNRLKGILTDRDIACRIVADGRDPDETLVRDIMTKDVHVCHADNSLVEAAQTMEDELVRRLPVVDDRGEIIGLLTADDLSWHTDHQLLGSVIEAVHEHRG